MNAPRKARNSFGIPFIRTGPENLKSVINLILAALDSVRCQPSADIDSLVTAEGTLNRLRQATGDGRRRESAFLHPFRVSLSDTSDPAAPTAAISASSRLYKSISSTNTQAITDLTTAFALAIDTHVWIQVTVSSLAITAASRQTGTAWPTLVVTSGSPAVQSQFNIPIGRVVASAPTKPGFEFAITSGGTTTPYHFEQCLFSHLLAENRCNNGTTILYAFPWGGAA
jgi:hypothetical protein